MSAEQVEGREGKVCPLLGAPESVTCSTLFKENTCYSSLKPRTSSTSNTFIVQLTHTTLKNVELLKHF